jgi:Protein of unknown function (DUF938)
MSGRAIALDAASEVWPIACADSILCINMIHITPWAASVGLIRGAAAVLPLGGLLRPLTSRQVLLYHQRLKPH